MADLCQYAKKAIIRWFFKNVNVVVKSKILRTNVAHNSFKDDTALCVSLPHYYVTQNLFSCFICFVYGLRNVIK